MAVLGNAAQITPIGVDASSTFFTYNKDNLINNSGLTGGLHGAAYSTMWMNNGTGTTGILTFDLADRAACYRFMDSLAIIRRATNINDNKTLILHPASTIFCEYSEEEKEALGVPSTMIRLTVGIEDKEDILDDLNKGLESL